MGFAIKHSLIARKHAPPAILRMVYHGSTFCASQRNPTPFVLIGRTGDLSAEKRERSDARPATAAPNATVQLRSTGIGLFTLFFGRGKKVVENSGAQPGAWCVAGRCRGIRRPLPCPRRAVPPRTAAGPIPCRWPARPGPPVSGRGDLGRSYRAPRPAPCAPAPRERIGAAIR